MTNRSQWGRWLPWVSVLVLLSGVAPAQAIDGLPDHPVRLPAALGSEQPPPVPTFLMPDEAFKLRVEPAANGAVTLNFTPAPGYYLYRDRIRVQGPAGSAKPQLAFPSAESKQDPSFGTVWVYHHPFQAQVEGIGSGAAPERLSVTYQGCADHGICYPPTTQTFLRTSGGDYQALSSGGDMSSTAPASDSARPEDFAGYLKGARPSLVMGFFFVAGLLLAFTPCLFPMVPILSGIIAGQGSSLTRGRAFTLSLTYVLGMAVTYAGVGILAGLTGTLLTNALQTPPVQIATAILFVALALASFDVYQIQMPLALQGHLQGTSARLPGGRFLGVGLMGAVAALVMGPCVAAPLAGSLLYIAQTHDVVLGGSALFIMALGMGVPLLVIGTSAGALLPRAGRWMQWVKRFFGVLLLGVALWTVWPLLHRTPTEGPAFDVIHSSAELDRSLERARSEHRPVMLDFYADWCTSCREMDHEVLARPEVEKALEDFVLLRADVTRNSADERALLARFGLFGPPGTLFYDARGRELGDARLAGFVPMAQFLGYLDRARGQ